MKVYMTKVFQNGGSKAIRIPAPLRPDADELFVWATAQPLLSTEAELFLKRDQPLDDFSSPLSKSTDF